MFGFGFGYGYGYGISTSLTQYLIDYKNFQVLPVGVDGKRYCKDSGINPKYPLALYSGQGKYSNGAEALLGTFTIPPTVTNMYYWFNGVFYDTTTLLDFSTVLPMGWYKDVYYFSRPLTATELTKLYEYPEDFFFDVKSGVITDCVSNMPMNDKDDYVRDYVSDTDYSITNPTTDTNDLAKNLPYGFQDALTVQDSLGLISAKSTGFEGNSISYGDTGWIPLSDSDWTIFMIIYIDENNIGFQFNGAYDSTSSDYLIIGLNSEKLQYRIGNVNTNVVLDDGFHHVAISYSNALNEFTPYVDGVAKNTINEVIDISDTFLLGQEKLNSLNPYEYSIPEFKVKASQSTQEEVTTAYDKAVSEGLLT